MALELNRHKVAAQRALEMYRLGLVRFEEKGLRQIALDATGSEVEACEWVNNYLERKREAEDDE